MSYRTVLNSSTPLLTSLHVPNVFIYLLYLLNFKLVMKQSQFDTDTYNIAQK